MMAPSREEPAPTYRPDIDGLRALAIVLVLLYHAFPTLCRAGFIGVDVFFVISGYLITRILLGRSQQGLTIGAYFWDFYQHRIRRIFPALIVVLLGSCIYGWFRLFPSEYEGLTKYVAAGAAFSTNFVLWSEAGYFDQAIELKPLMHLWSLAIEEQFYLIWPLLILLVGWLGKGKGLPWTLAALVLMSFAYSASVTSADPTAAYYSPLSRAWELGAGGLLASLHARGITARPGVIASLASAFAFAVIPVAAFVVVDKTQFPGWQALLPVGATAAIVWFGAGAWTDRYLLGLPPVRYIGKISYPLYLWHWVILSFIRIENPLPPGTVKIAALLAGTVLAVATYHLVEQPLRRLKLATVSVTALAMMVAIFAFGVAAHTWHWSGVQLTPTQIALGQAYDPEPAYRYRQCFLDSVTQTAADFAPECSTVKGPVQPKLLLWGDSLAADLYPGLAAQGATLSHDVFQRTATSCPPSTADDYSDRGNCNQINASTRAYIASARPEVVVVSARWPEEASQREKQITALVKFLRASGARTVVLVGPAPDWAPDLRGMLIRTQFPNDVLPEYLPPPGTTWRKTVARDTDLAQLAGRLGIGYLSIVEHFCREGECRIRVSGDIPAGLITSDHDHLTAEASAFLLADLKQSPFWKEE